jgi:hypothetical protein
MASETNRQFKMAWMTNAFNLIKTRKKKVQVSKFLAQFQEACLTTERTGLELLKMYEGLEAIRIKDGEIEVLI